MVLVAEGVAGADVLEADACADVAAADDLLGVLLVGVHLEETADALFLAGAGVEDVASGGHLAAIYAEEAESTDVGVGGNLECEGAHGGLGAGLAGLHLVFVVGVVSLHCAGVFGGGEVCAYGVEQCLYALVLEGGAANHGVNLHGECGLADCGADFVLGEIYIDHI